MCAFRIRLITGIKDLEVRQKLTGLAEFRIVTRTIRNLDGSAGSFVRVSYIRSSTPQTEALNQLCVQRNLRFQQS